MKGLFTAINFALKLFVLGLIVRVVFSWVRSPGTRKFEAWLDRVYEPLLRPIRLVVKPLKLNSSPPTALDLAPLILVLLVWWIVHPLLIWLLT